MGSCYTLLDGVAFGKTSTLTVITPGVFSHDASTLYGCTERDPTGNGGAALAKRILGGPPGIPTVVSSCLPRLLKLVAVNLPRLLKLGNTLLD